MHKIRHFLLVTVSMLLTIGGLVGLTIFIVTFDQSHAVYIGLVVSGACLIAGLAIIRSITKSWGDAFAEMLDVFFWGWPS